MTQPPFLILVHIPKTGGTSLRVAAESHFGRRRMLYDYGPDARQTSELVRRHVHDQRDLAALREAALAGGYRMLAGHFPAHKYRETFPDARWLSWLRHPVERAWSAWRHHRTRLGYAGDFESFYTQPRHVNQQARMLGGSLEAFDFVGVTEHFRRSLAALESRLDLSLPMVRANRDTAPREEPPGPEVCAAVLELNREDLALHEAATQQVLASTPVAARASRWPGFLRRLVGG